MRIKDEIITCLLKISLSLRVKKSQVDKAKFVKSGSTNPAFNVHTYATVILHNSMYADPEWQTRVHLRVMCSFSYNDC